MWNTFFTDFKWKQRSIYRESTVIRVLGDVQVSRTRTKSHQAQQFMKCDLYVNIATATSTELRDRKFV